MPLLDHFNPPLSRTHPWRSFHSAWAAAMARLLNRGVLPEGFYAVPLCDNDRPAWGVPDDPAVTAKPWAPPAAAEVVALEIPPADAVEVQVIADDDEPRPVAAVELLGPLNKLRPLARHAFAIKCAGYLQHRCCIVVVDTVTTWHADLQSTILSQLGIAKNETAAAPPLSAVSYLVSGNAEQRPRLQRWQESLAVGVCLPTLPLWISADVPVPLDLEASYIATCKDLRISEAQ
jgi:hypothetical protein